jgi:hypothetical protein
MKYLPFPEPLRSAYAARVGADYEAEMAQRRKSGARGPYTPPVGSKKVRRDALCYRMPDGTLRSVYDRYNAEYPEGSTPGTGTITDTFHWYPNDTGGYVTTVADFEPLKS